MNTNNLSISYSLQTDKMSKVTDARLLGSNHKQSVTMNVNMKSYFGENSSGVIRQVKVFLQEIISYFFFKITLIFWGWFVSAFYSNGFLTCYELSEKQFFE